MGEELCRVREGFEFQSVACGIKEEHGGLLAYLSFEADVGLDDKGDVGGSEAVCEGLPGLHRENDAEVRHGDFVSVHGIVVLDGRASARLVVRNDLVTEEVEVDPLRGATAFRTAKGGAVKMARGGEIVDGEGDVERGKGQRDLREMLR